MAGNIKTLTHIKNWNLRDVCEVLFLHVLCLQVLRNEFDGIIEAKEYVVDTLRRWDKFQTQGTEISNLSRILLEDDLFERMRDGSRNQAWKNKVRISQALTIFLNDIKHDRTGPREKLCLRSIEKDWNITTPNYRSMRVLLEKWDYQDTQAKALVITRLLQAMRHRCRSSRLLPPLEKISQQQHLEISGARNPEKDPILENTTSGNVALAMGGFTDDYTSSIYPPPIRRRKKFLIRRAL